MAKSPFRRISAGSYLHTPSSFHIVNIADSWYVITPDFYRLLPPFPTLTKAKAFVEERWYGWNTTAESFPPIQGDRIILPITIAPTTKKGSQP